MSGGYRTQLKIHGLEPGEIPLEGEAIWDPIGRKLGFWDFDNSEITWFRIPKYGDSESYIPNHRWVDTTLQFQDADGNWGEAVNLYGGYIENIDTIRNNDNSYTFKFTTQGPNGQEIFTVTTDPIESYYKGTWNALSNSPAIVSGQGVTGEYYVVNVAGSTNIDNEVVWNVGDQIRFNGTEWERIPIVAPVTAVNGKSGNVVLTANDISGVVKTSQVGMANGIAPLDSNAKIDAQYLPVDGSFLGTWNANTNTPTITSSIGTAGQYYIVGVAGTTNVDGTTTWDIGDQIRFNGTIWQRIPTYQAVSSVNGKVGVVTLTADDISGISTVGKTGSYADLSGKPTLGTAAATNTTAYATAAQGTKADSALQPLTGVYKVDTFANASSVNIPNVVKRVYIEDRGAHFKEVVSEPSHALKFVNDGRWFEIDELVVTSKMAGAIADGIVDDASAISNWLSLGGNLFLSPGRHMCKGLSVFEIPENTVIKGIRGKSIWDFSNRSGLSDAAGKYLINSRGSAGSDVNLTANMVSGSVVVEVPTASFSEGDLVIVHSNAQYFDTSGPGGAYYGEYAIIDEIIDSTKLRVNIPVKDSYLLSDTARICKINPKKDISIEGITFVGQGRVGNGNSGGDRGVGFTYCQNVSISNCDFIRIDQEQLTFRSCYNCEVKYSYFYHTKYFSPSGTPGINKPSPLAVRGTVQYQIRVSDCCTDIKIIGCRGEGSRHFFNTGTSYYLLDGTLPLTVGGLFGINRYIKVIDCTSKNTWHANYSTHNDCQYVDFINCLGQGSGMAAFNPRASKIGIIDCKALDTPQGVYLSGTPSNIIVDGMYITNVQNALFTDVESLHDIKDLTIKNCEVVNTTNGGFIVNLAGGTQTGKIVIQNNLMKNIQVTGNGCPIRVLGAAVKVWVKDNVVLGTSGGYCARIEADISEAYVIGNHFQGGLRPLTILAGVGIGYVANNTQYQNSTSTTWSNAATVQVNNNNI